MNHTENAQKRRLISNKNIFDLLAVILFYFLGSGISRYLGKNIDWGILFLGLGIVVFLFASGLFLQMFFNPVSKESGNLVIQANGHGWHNNSKYLLAGLTALTSSFILFYLVAIRNTIPISAVLLLITLFLLVFLYAIPPFKLAAHGYGELLLTIWIVVLIPAFAFLLQSSMIHHLVAMLSFPLMTLFLAMMISTNLQGYLADMISGKKTIVIMLGWKLGMDMHNWLVLVTYMQIAVASLLELPWNITWPMLLSAPISALTVYEIFRIKAGIKPRWSLLLLSGYAGIGCMLYMLLFTLWFR